MFSIIEYLLPLDNGFTHLKTILSRLKSLKDFYKKAKFGPYFSNFGWFFTQNIMET